MSQKDIEKAAKAPDAFLTLSDKLLKEIEKHRYIFGGIFAGVLIVATSWTAWEYWSRRQESKALSEIYKFQAELTKKQETLEKIEEPAEIKDKKDGKKAQTKPAKAVKPTVDFTTSYSEIAKNLESAIMTNSATASAMTAAVELVGFYLDHSQLDLAHEFLSRLQPKGNSLAGGLLQMQKATILLSRSDWQNAQGIFQEISNNKALEHLHPQALLRMGLCLEKLNQADRAREIYNRVATDYPESEASRTAKLYLRLLSLNPKSEKKAG